MSFLKRAVGRATARVRPTLLPVAIANVHSSPNHVGGEIRSQIKVLRGDEDDK